MALAGSSLFVVPKIHAFTRPHTLSVKAKSQSQGLHHPSDVNVGIKFHQYDLALKYSSGNISDDKNRKSHASSTGKVTSADSSSSSSSTDISTNTKMSEAVAERVKSVNYFISRECNYSCKFCFHTQKNVDKLELEDAKRGLKMLKDAGTEKVSGLSRHRVTSHSIKLTLITCSRLEYRFVRAIDVSVLNSKWN